MLSGLFRHDVDPLARTLSWAHRRHALLAGNIANLETPGYRARELAFPDALQAAVTGPAGAPPDRIVGAGDGPPRADGNDVHLDGQMARMAGNALFAQALTRVLASRFATLRHAIGGRG
jgi:flagellar basal-body rod protein FlgB